MQTNNLYSTKINECIGVHYNPWVSKNTILHSTGINKMSSPVVGAGVIIQMRLSIPFGWLLNRKAARVDVNISMAFLHWVEMAVHP